MENDQDRISYSEGAKVAIGDYESRDIHLSYSTSVKENETPKEAFKRAKTVVQDRLKVGEKRIRTMAEDDVDFETLDRLEYYPDASKKKKKKKNSKKKSK